MHKNNTMNLLHHSRLQNLLQIGKVVTIRYFSHKEGKEILFKDWIITSVYSKGGSVNIMNPVNKEVRKLTRLFILYVNDIEIIL